MSGKGGSKALELLRSLPRVSLANLRPSPGSKKPVSACGLSGGSRVCVPSGGGTLPRQRPRTARWRLPRGLSESLWGGGGRPRRAAWPEQAWEGRAAGGSVVCVGPVLAFLVFVAGVCGCPHGELGSSSGPS